jgi:hypothetical protein
MKSESKDFFLTNQQLHRLYEINKSFSFQIHVEDQIFYFNKE